MHPTPLSKILLERIPARGPITFAEYMDACLYHSAHGYYAQVDTRRFADYYTSVDVHPIFGRLLARQLVEMWELLGCPAEFMVVEAGAGTGRLARQILEFTERALPEFHAALRYAAVDRTAQPGSARRRALEAALSPFERASAANELPAKIPAGCIFSNELFDALPVHRVVQEKGELREIYVDAKENGLCEVSRPVSSPLVTEYFMEQDIELAEGQHAEAALEACRWLYAIVMRLGRGFVLTIDYGHEAGELYSERHARGTVMAYEHHRATEDLYAAPGEQDLTAHVNFSALETLPTMPRASRLERSGLVSQTRFLLSLGRANDFADLYGPEQTEQERFQARQGLKTLIHPEGMGEMFKVLIQHKGIESPRLTGLRPL